MVHSAESEGLEKFEQHQNSDTLSLGLAHLPVYSLQT